MKVPLVLVCILMILCGCASLPDHSKDSQKEQSSLAKKGYPFLVKIDDFFGAEGFGLTYYIDKAHVVVVVWNDFGEPAREVLNRELTVEEAGDMENYLAGFQLDKLKSEYRDSRVYDGLQRHFVFRIRDSDHNIFVANVYVPELVALCNKINSFLPESMRLRGGGAAAVGPSSGSRD